MIGGLLLLTLAAPSPHAAALLEHQGTAPVTKPRRLYGGPPQTPRVQRMVYGYYPYWVDAWDELRWDLLTHLAYFAVEIEQDGTISARHGWPDTNFVEAAHAHGVRVDLSFTLFSGSGIRNLTCNAGPRAQAIRVMIDEMEAGGADGINVDFEGLLDGTRDCFTTFILELRDALTARGHPDAGISIAGPAVDWTGEFDLGALAPAIEAYFIMGYGYHWSGSSKAGPNCPLQLTPAWRPHLSISMQRTLAHYTGLVPPEHRHKIVFGVPYYGQEWPTASGAIHAATTGDGTSRTYAASRQAVTSGRVRQWDPETQNAWYSYQQGGTWRQNWYDDEESLAAKYQLILEQDLGGVGIWALGYDQGYPELWDLLDGYFTAAPTTLEGTAAHPRIIDQFPYQEDNNSTLGPSNYFNAYGCQPNLQEYGREWVYQIELCEPGTLSAEVNDGPDVDIDLHLLSGPREDQCLSRNDLRIQAELQAGTYYLVADSYVDDHLPQEGAYQLRVDFLPAPDSPGCVVLPEPTPTRPVVVVGDFEVQPGQNPEPAPIPPLPEVNAPEPEGGCDCQTTNNPLNIWIAAGLLIRRRRRDKAG
ncbi:MAG: hypothetical protein IPG45_29540 [Deltaproteobacteria bacterium]|nr:hypothetical protein [Deltaproteobacteria bacterium]